MPAGIAVILVVGLVVAVIIIFSVAAWRSMTPPSSGLNRQARLYIDELEATIEHLQELAYDNKTLDPSFADIVIDEIKMHKSRVKRKELET